jgi:hypothetical protein
MAHLSLDDPRLVLLAPDSSSAMPQHVRGDIDTRSPANSLEDLGDARWSQPLDDPVPEIAQEDWCIRARLFGGESLPVGF